MLAVVCLSGCGGQSMPLALVEAQTWPLAMGEAVKDAVAGPDGQWLLLLDRGMAIIREGEEAWTRLPMATEDLVGIAWRSDSLFETLTKDGVLRTHALDGSLVSYETMKDVGFLKAGVRSSCGWFVELNDSVQTRMALVALSGETRWIRKLEGVHPVRWHHGAVWLTIHERGALVSAVTRPHDVLLLDCIGNVRRLARPASAQDDIRPERHVALRAVSVGRSVVQVMADTHTDRRWVRRFDTRSGRLTAVYQAAGAFGPLAADAGSSRVLMSRYLTSPELVLYRVE